MFYKYENEELFRASYEVHAPDYRILINLKDTYTYPVNGWYYFETEDEAYIFFNIEKQVDA